MVNTKQRFNLHDLREIASPMPPFILELREKIRKGDKWQTRRPMNPQPPADVAKSNFVEDAWHCLGGSKYLHPKYPKAIRYLREPLCKGEDGLAHYRDDMAMVIDSEGQQVKWGWKRDLLTQIFLPSDLARSFFSWTVIGIQHIADITNDDIKAEGVRNSVNYGPILYDDFRNLWDGINARRGFGFDSNPYVWAYEFHSLSQNMENNEIQE